MKKTGISFFLLLDAIERFLFDTSSLSGQLTQVVQLSATNFTAFVHLNLVDEWRIHREDTLHADVITHLTNGETLRILVTNDLDDYATIVLHTLLVTFFDTIRNGDSVARTKFRKLFLLARKCGFCNFNKIHFG